MKAFGITLFLEIILSLILYQVSFALIKLQVTNVPAINVIAKSVMVLGWFSFVCDDQIYPLRTRLFVEKYLSINSISVHAF